MSKVPADLEWGHDIKAGTVEVADQLILPYVLKTEGLVEYANARSHIGYWRGTINFSSLVAAALTEDVKFIGGFPAGYKILEILVDNSIVWDDAGGPISAVTLSVGWTGAAYSDLILTQDIYTAVTRIGDAAGELNYTAVQGGIRPSWGANTDLYLRFIAVGGNLNTLTTGRCSIYITYQAF